MVPVQPARRLDAQSERRLEEPAKSVARTNGTSGRKSRSRAKKAPAAAPSQTDGLSARREPTDELSARREPTDELSVRRESTDELSVRRESMDELSVRRESKAELSARREPPTCAAQNLARPHRSSYFLPGKAAGLTMLYLVDTGCNTNLVSKRVFDRLPKHIRDQHMECDTHGQMADDTRLPFYRVVQIPIRV